MMFSKWFLLTLASWCGLVNCQREPKRFNMGVAEDYDFGQNGHGWYIVGISDHGHFARTGEDKRVCAGIIVKLDLVLTAATPMRQYDRPEGAHDLKVGYYQPDKYMRHMCWWTQVRYIKFHEDNRDMYSSIDPFRTNADMAMLRLTENMKSEGMTDKKYRWWGPKWPAAVPAVFTNEEIEESKLVAVLHDYTMLHFTFCGSGANPAGDYRVLTVHCIKSPTDRWTDQNIVPLRIVDCNQLFIGGWGKFICIKTWGRGCDSGSALVKHGKVDYYVGPSDLKTTNWKGRPVLGMCSFSITVEGQTYMIFTDFTKDEHKKFIRDSIATYKEWV